MQIKRRRGCNHLIVYFDGGLDPKFRWVQTLQNAIRWIKANGNKVSIAGFYHHLYGDLITIPEPIIRA